MRFLRFIIVVTCLAAPVAAVAALSARDLPPATTWYFHADFSEMRSSAAGQPLFGWLQDEVFEDLYDETGVDLGTEADHLTAFVSGEGGMVILIEGDISQDTEDKVVALAASSGKLDRHGAFYYIDGDDEHGNDGNIDINLDSLDRGAYFSFAIDGKLIVTSTRETMESLLETRGRVAGERATNGQLFVLTAERNLLQAGARTTELQGNGDWESNIFRNTEQVALLIAEKAGQIAIEVELMTTAAEMADSMASIVRGLISLQVFNADTDPDLTSFLQNTKVDVDGTRLTINVTLDPDKVVAAID